MLWLYGIEVVFWGICEITFCLNECVWEISKQNQRIAGRKLDYKEGYVRQKWGLYISLNAKIIKLWAIRFLLSQMVNLPMNIDKNRRSRGIFTQLTHNLLLGFGFVSCSCLACERAGRSFVGVWDSSVSPRCGSEQWEEQLPPWMSPFGFCCCLHVF